MDENYEWTFYRNEEQTERKNSSISLESRIDHPKAKDYKGLKHIICEFKNHR